MGWFILLLLIGVFIIIGINGQKKEAEIKENFRISGIDIDDFVKIGTYVGGHPNKNENSDYCFVDKSGKDLVFYRKIITEPPVEIFRISIESVKNITIEDASSIEKKVTLGRVLLVGVFALAWKKKKKNEIAFVVIEWNDGRFDNSTTFSIEGSDSMQTANTARNELIKICR